MQKRELHKMLKCCFVLLIFALLPGCMGAAVTGANAVYNHNALEDKFNDYSITLKIKHALQADPSLKKNTHIEVATFQRLVLLVGQVPSESLRQRAASAAQTAPGAIRIYNFITVGQPMNFAERNADTWITTKIRSQIIMDHKLYPNKVKVVTEAGVVYLMGVVTKEEADRVIEMAKNTDGVLRIVKIFFYMKMPELK